MNLVDLAGALKRTVAGPGEFDTYFPESDNATLAGVLTDAAAEAQLDGFMPTRTIDAVAMSLTPDPNSLEQALVVIYAGARVLTGRIANLKNATRYKAGNVEAETSQAATVLQELLRQLQARKKQLLDDLKAGYLVNGPDGLESGIGTSSIGMFGMADLYLTKSLDWGPYGYPSHYGLPF